MEFRQVLANKLEELMNKDNKVCVLDADLAKPNGTYPLYSKFPTRCFNVGIAEQNMIGIAAGLSAYGMKPVALTFAPFMARRACDQIALSVAYAKQNVKLIGTDPGITAETNGGTHMAFEDASILRAMPNMIVYDAVDYNEFGKSFEQLMDIPTAAYIRMPRKARPAVYDEKYNGDVFTADLINKGEDITIVASGVLAYEAKCAVEELSKSGINADLIIVKCIKPLDKKTILESIIKTNKVVTCENHNIIGGLFSAVSELVVSEHPCKVAAIGVQDKFGQVGAYNDLLREYELTKDDIIKKVKGMLNE